MQALVLQHAVVSTFTCSINTLPCVRQYCNIRTILPYIEQSQSTVWWNNIVCKLKYWCVNVKVLTNACLSTDLWMSEYCRLNVLIFKPELLRPSTGTGRSQKNCNGILRKTISTYHEILLKWWNPSLSRSCFAGFLWQPNPAYNLT